MLMSFLARENATSEGHAPLTVAETSRSPADGARRSPSPRALEASEFEPFAVEVQRDDHGAVVQPRGELDLATIDMLDAAVELAIAETLRAAPDGTERHARLVLDLRGLSFIDSTGLRMLVALHRRAQHEGFQLMMYAPGAPADRAIQVCGLDEVLPFVAPVEASGSNGNA
jgi:anti-anti-sigma factor